MRVKVCGITNLEDALVAAMAGADALGFNFWPGSSRHLESAAAAQIVAHLPPFVTPVGVFVDDEPERVASLAERAGLQAVQLHGRESAKTVRWLVGRGLLVLKALRVGRRFEPKQLRAYPDAAAFLLDADIRGQRGGTGKTFDWSRARAASRYGRIFLAGGLTPENVRDAIAQAQPYGVDVCSGVEKRPGVKDHQRLRAFIAAAKGVGVR